jgi:ASCH domain
MPAHPRIANGNRRVLAAQRTAEIAPAHKALSVRQPFADLIVRGLKPIENRTWRTNYRGLVYIHAGMRPHTMTQEEIEQCFRVRLHDHPRSYGAIIGRATLIDIVETHDSHWFTGPYGWVFENPELLDPVPMKGACLSSRSTDWRRKITRGPRWTASSLRPDLVFTTHSLGPIAVVRRPKRHWPPVTHKRRWTRQ